MASTPLSHMLVHAAQAQTGALKPYKGFTHPSPRQHAPVEPMVHAAQVNPAAQ